MRILFFTEVSHSGGLDTFIAALINHWPRPEDELVVLCNPAHPGLSLLRTRIGNRARVESHDVLLYGDLVLRTSGSVVLTCLRRAIAPIARALLFTHSVFFFRRLFRRLNPDRVLVISGGFPGGDSCRAAVFAWTAEAGTRPYALYNVHNLAVTATRRNRLEQMLDRALAKSVRGIVAVSRACAKSMQVRPAIWAACNIGYILNGIETRPVIADPAAVRIELGLEAACPLVLMLATYEPRKGHAFLFATFKQVLRRVPNARLVVCGYGYPEEINQVKTALRGAGVENNVTLGGYREDVARLLAAADVLVVPSQVFESFGLTCVEAMAAGVPVVATRVGGLPEVVENGDGGYCVEHDDVAGFADRVALLLENNELHREQSTRGKQRYARLFTADRMAQQYAALITSPEITAAKIPFTIQKPENQ